MSTEVDSQEVAKLEAALAFDVDPDTGGPMTDAKKAEIEARLSILRGDPEGDEEYQAMQSLLGTPQGQPEPNPKMNTAESTGGVDAQLAEIKAQLAALSSGVQQVAPQQPVTLKDVLDSLDPRDSDAALALFSWLWDNKRFGVVGTLNGGGYLLHYQEPQGTTQAGYVAGGTQGSRFVDAAVEKVKESGAQPVRRGLCATCMSAVRETESGIIVLDDDDNPMVDCTGNPGGGHTLVS